MIDISIVFQFLLSSLWLQQNPASGQLQKEYKEVSASGILLQWRLQQEFLECIVTAPTQGWVAVGFNVNKGLSGTNLIMGAVEEDFFTLDDRFILSPGNHQSILELGGSHALTKCLGKEEKGITTIHFSLPVVVNDKYHHSFYEGKLYHLLLAYSEDDDFTHHSRVRTSVTIKL